MNSQEPRGVKRRLPSGRSLIVGSVGIAVGWTLIGLGALVVIEGGLFDATASTPHNPIVAAATHTAFIRSVQLRAVGIRAPGRFTSGQIQAGLADYDASCAACHGAPGVSRASWANAMTPSPPYLSDSARRWRPRELYWIIGQGAKMTAMPAWAESRTDAQLWNLVAFLEAMPDLTSKDYATRRRPASSVAAAPGPSTIQEAP